LTEGGVILLLVTLLVKKTNSEHGTLLFSVGVLSPTEENPARPLFSVGVCSPTE